MSNIEVFYQEAAELQTDVSVRYVKSGLEDIKYYAETVIKPDLDNYEQNVVEAKINAYTEEKRVALNGYLEQAQNYAFSAAQKDENAGVSAQSAALSAEQASESLGHYYTKAEIDSQISAINDEIGNISSALDNINGEIV